MVPEFWGFEFEPLCARWIGDKACWKIPLPVIDLSTSWTPYCSLRANSWSHLRDIETCLYCITGFILEGPTLKYKYHLANPATTAWARFILKNLAVRYVIQLYNILSTNGIQV
jgi:hypothetical protein